MTVYWSQGVQAELAARARREPVEPLVVGQDALPLLAFFGQCVVRFAVHGGIFVIRAVLRVRVLGSQDSVPPGYSMQPSLPEQPL